MRLALDASHTVELEPLLVAEIDGGLFIVDGHHRLKAYQGAHRETAPCRAMLLKRRQAVMVSKLVNCSERALEMHAEQKRDAAWQYLAAMTKQGACELPKNESLRSVGSQFGVNHETIRTMLRKLPDVSPKDFQEEAKDTGTGFPRWRYVRTAGAGWQDMEKKMTHEQLEQHHAEKLATKVGRLLYDAPEAVMRRALAMLANEAKLEAMAPDARGLLEEIAGVTGDDY
ncbi:ParB/RepB/Spo0J family partition protein [Dyella sp.]|uniref:ParB/RepB/Spo0J family partition protein n=1 Tax=Dyella sp. TaxID=1869338 RepID=UPI00284E9BC4|nr:ParB/RepB/Spo0J family partition protein [Dyella sp.]MDR3446027.1 ParB/RepB/Spo0J family partition protein [Dyella sp.]